MKIKRVLVDEAKSIFARERADRELKWDAIKRNGEILLKDGGKLFLQLEKNRPAYYRTYYND